jgi:hypothetical protein
MIRKAIALAARIGAAGYLAVIAAPARAHCDGLDGPVAKAGMEALQGGKIDPALAWVQPDGEAELRRAFTEARTVRALGPEARALADRSFLETLVRIHRAGEGEPYTGLKPAGRDLGPAIPAADAAAETGSTAKLEALLTADVREGLKRRIAKVNDLRPHASHGAEAGRAYVAAYVDFLHYAEKLHELAAVAPGHAHAAPAQAKHAEAGHAEQAAAHAEHAAPAEKPEPKPAKHAH